jgi:hypothetical protein
MTAKIQIHIPRTTLRVSFSPFQWGEAKPAQSAGRIPFNHPTDGEFHVDLYTLPDSLVKQLWDFTASKVDL